MAHVFIQNVDQELQEVKLKLKQEQEKVTELESKLKKVEVRSFPDSRSAKWLWFRNKQVLAYNG